MKIGRFQVALLLLMSVLGGAPLRAYADREHQVKSAFIFDMAKFCEWDNLGGAGAPFVIGLYRADSYGTELDNLLGSKSVLGHRVSVRRFDSMEELTQCRMVVVGDVRAGTIRQLTSILRNSGTVLIGESPGFAQAGGVVGFVVTDRNVRFEVNLRSAQADRVNLGSKLLSLATEVYR